MRIIKKIDNENHIIEFCSINKIENFLKKNVSDIDILIIDKELIKINNIKRIQKKFSKRCFLLKGHEKIKDLNHFNSMIEKILKKGIQRKSKLFSIGGGTIGDLSGFISSTLLRGIDHIMIPTSLLAMVDSSIGGKTGVNSQYGKNLIGTFYLPKKILISSDFLKTLPMREINCGFAEIIKYSFINSGVLRKKLINFKDLDKSNINEIIKLSVLTKLKYVTDFKEKSGKRNSRAILNFGHTVGHAIESYLLDKNQPIMHGFAVAKGIIIEAFFAHKLNLLSKSDFEEINNTINKYFNNSLNFNIDVSKILSLMKGDKKNNSSNINFSLPNSIGKVSIDNEISIDTIEAFLLEFLKND